MGVQLPRSPVRLSLFRCPTLSLLCPALSSLCPTPSLDSSCSLSFARVPYIYYLFFYMGVKSGWFVSWFRGENLFHTQRPFSVLTLLAFGDEKYYICIEIWEEPRILPFFVTSPLKTGILGAHLGKISLPLIFLSLPLIFLSLPLSKTKCRVGKIWRRKVFPKVKNVNVESPKKHSKLLFFSARFFLFPLQEPHEWLHQSGFHFFGGARIVFWNTNGFCLEHELNTNWTRIVHEIDETINGH